MELFSLLRGATGDLLLPELHALAQPPVAECSSWRGASGPEQQSSPAFTAEEDSFFPAQQASAQPVVAGGSTSRGGPVRGIHALPLSRMEDVGCSVVQQASPFSLSKAIGFSAAQQGFRQVSFPLSASRHPGEVWQQPRGTKSSSEPFRDGSLTFVFLQQSRCPSLSSSSPALSPTTHSSSLPPAIFIPTRPSQSCATVVPELELEPQPSVPALPSPCPSPGCAEGEQQPDMMVVFSRGFQPSFLFARIEKKQGKQSKATTAELVGSVNKRAVTISRERKMRTKRKLVLAEQRED